MQVEYNVIKIMKIITLIILYSCYNIMFNVKLTTNEEEIADKDEREYYIKTVVPKYLNISTHQIILFKFIINTYVIIFK